MSKLLRNISGRWVSNKFPIRLYWTDSVSASSKKDYYLIPYENAKLEEICYMETRSGADKAFPSAFDYNRLMEMLIVKSLKDKQ